MYELYIERQLVDIDQTLSIQLSYAIDDINDFGSRNTSFSKSVVLMGTARNNKVFGNVLKETTSNPYSVETANVNENFNPSDVALCELRQNGLLMLKGVFRLISIKLTNGVYEYEGVIFGELGGFVTAISNKKLEDLDYSDYNHILNISNISNSWDNIDGNGYYYPLADYGTYSTNKVDYDIRTFRPAIYAKDYIDRIFAAAGYSYESDFINSNLFKSIIIPHNTKRLTKESGSLLDADFSGSQILAATTFVEYDTAIGGNFTNSVNNSQFQYNQSQSVFTTITLFLQGFATITESTASFLITINGVLLAELVLGEGTYEFAETITVSATFNLNDILRVRFVPESRGAVSVDLNISRLDVTTSPPSIVIVDEGDTVDMNYNVPKGIFQREFFGWILKMFNLYVDEDRLEERKLIIKPFINYYSYGNRLDWNQKIDYSKTLEFTPMGQLNGRIFEYKYKQDNDFYNESYQKKFNQSYGDIQYDTGFEFSKDKQTVEIGFSPTVLVRYSGVDKYVSVFYKKSTGNDIDQEELNDTNIRILFAKKITGVNSWKIKDGTTDLATITNYGYAGHLNDPENPTADLNFGAPSEIFFTTNAYTGNGLFNVYWKSYILEISNKDSKLLKCYAYLTEQDIADLDFAKPVFINGALYRLNKIEDYDAENPVVRVELIKIINAVNG